MTVQERDSGGGGMKMCIDDKLLIDATRIRHALLSPSPLDHLFQGRCPKVAIFILNKYGTFTHIDRNAPSPIDRFRNSEERFTRFRI